MLRAAPSGEQPTAVERLRGLYGGGAAEASRAPPPGPGGLVEWEKLATQRCMEEQAMLREERDQLRVSLQKVDPSVAVAVHRNLELCATGVAQMRQDTVRFRQLLEQARYMSQQLDDVSQLHNANAILENTHITMGSEIQMLKYELAELRTQMMNHNKAAPVGGAETKANAFEGQFHYPLVLVMGGFNGKAWLNSAELYSPLELRSYPAAPMLSSRSYAASSSLNNYVYVLGGGNGRVRFNTVERYDPENNCWAPAPPMKHKLGNLAAVTVGDTLYAIGGGDGDIYNDDVECFCPEPGTWLTRASLLEKRYMVSAVELDRAIYAIGGFDGKKYLRSMERFDFRENLWRGMPEMQSKRGCFSAAALNGRIYVLGGFDGSFLSTVEVFDTRAGRWDWSAGQEMTSPRAYSTAVSVNDNIYILGGWKAKNETCETWDVFNEDAGWTSVISQGLEKRSFLTASLLI